MREKVRLKFEIKKKMKERKKNDQTNTYRKQGKENKAKLILQKCDRNSK